MTITRSVGATGRNHSSLASFESWVQTTDHGAGAGVLNENVEAVIYDDTAAGTAALSPSATIIFTGITMGAYTITLRAANATDTGGASDVWYDNADPTSDRLYPDEDLGVLIDCTAAPLIDIRSGGLRLEGLQLTHSKWYGNYVVDLYPSSGGVDEIQVDKCIIYLPRVNGTPYSVVYGRRYTFRDSLVITHDGRAPLVGANYGDSEYNNCTLVNLTTDTPTGNVCGGAYTVELNNCAVYNHAGWSGSPTYTGDYNVSDVATNIPGANSDGTGVFADDFEDTTGGTDTTYDTDTLSDLRATAGNALDGTGSTSLQTTEDIFNQTRSVTAPFVGAHEILASGGATLLPTLLTESQTHYSPTVTPGAVGISPVLVASSETLYTPTIQASVDILPSLLTSSALVSTPTLTPGTVILTPGLIAGTSQGYTATVVPGAVGLTPDAIASAAAVYEASVVAEGGVLTPSLLQAGTSIYDPSLTPGTVILTPSVLSSGAVLYTATVTPAGGSVTLLPSLLLDPATFSDPTLIPGAVSIAVQALLDNSETIYDPTVNSVVVITPSGILQAQPNIFSASLAPGAAEILPALLASSPTISVASVTGGYTPTGALIINIIGL